MIPRTIPALRRAAWGIVLVVLAAHVARLALPGLRSLPGEVAAAIGALADGSAMLAPAQSPAQAAVTLAVIAAWLLAGAVLPVLGRRWTRSRRPGRGPDAGRRGVLPVAGAVLALAGVGMLALLALAWLAPAGVTVPVPVATVAAVAAAAAIVRPGGPTGVLEPPGAPEPPDAAERTEAPWPAGPGAAGAAGPGSFPERLVRAAISLAVAAALLLLAWTLAGDAVHLAVRRGEATGDEAYFWWRATVELRRLGLDGYLAGFDVASYPPGYPLLANLLLGWLPDPAFGPALRALPFVLGATVLAILFRGSLAPRTLLGPATGLVALVAVATLQRLPWVHEMLFRLWYGESMAIAITAVLFVILDRARGASVVPESGDAATAPASTGAANRGRALPGLPALALLAVGIGAFAAIGKPPLSMLLLPAALPAYLVAALLLRRRGTPWRPLVTVVAAVAAGAVATGSLWGGALREAGVAPYYAVSPAQLLDLHPEGSFARLVPYVVRDYAPVWVTAGLVAALALLADPRRFLPPLVVAGGMIASVLLLYLGPWRDVEHESGARYILHGALGWVVFALGALAPALNETLDGWARTTAAWLGAAGVGRARVGRAHPGRRPAA